MALPNAYAQYANNKALTASPGELTLMLYEGMIKFCNRAIDGANEKNIQKTHDNIRKIRNIVDYLRSTLDMRYPVAQDFEKLYLVLNRRLTEANLSKTVEDLEKVNEFLHMLRDTWKEVMEKNKRGEV